jgi:4-carboxymuconolactone decarboxylase
MDDSHAKGLEVFKEMMPGLVPDNVTSLRDGGFADELGDLSIDHIFGALWTRPGLDRRSRRPGNPRGAHRPSGRRRA